VTLATIIAAHKVMAESYGVYAVDAVALRESSDLVVTFARRAIHHATAYRQLTEHYGATAHQINVSMRCPDPAISTRVS